MRSPLVVELIPLGPAEGALHNPIRSERPRTPAAAPLEGRRRAAQPVRLIAFVAPPSKSAGEGIAVATSSETAGYRGGPSPSDFSDYQRRLYQALAAVSRYPAEARRLSLSGVTRLAFKIDRPGKVLDSWIQDSSGSELLDNAALEALERAQPLPPIPASLPSRMDFVIEIDLSVMQRNASWSAGPK
ncbi:energy transducer TonB [Sphingomonas gei]|uniref:Energy transducer TonB n=2 Tax=Sphingomonas gei TaxID=1395960 RepID=A0A4S1X0J5_9SPHN|nr:energy transducer TonB [Sphingomonas gei]